MEHTTYVLTRVLQEITQEEERRDAIARRHDDADSRRCIQDVALGMRVAAQRVRAAIERERSTEDKFSCEYCGSTCCDGECQE